MIHSLSSSLRNILETMHSSQSKVTFVKTDELNFPSPAASFKVGTLSEIKEDRKEIHIIIDKCIPVADTGMLLLSTKNPRESFLIFSGLSVRCADHIASGVAKGITISKILNVQKLSLCTKHLEQLLHTLKLVL